MTLNIDEWKSRTHKSQPLNRWDNALMKLLLHKEYNHMQPNALQVFSTAGQPASRSVNVVSSFIEANC